MTSEVTYADIVKANETIRTTDIKGKEYAEVNQRIKAFRIVHPLGGILTEIVSLENGTAVMRATVTDYHGTILGTGTAYEKEGSTFINKTSYIENCETSAVGRALGMAGFGIDVSVASAEEVQNAIMNQSRQEFEKREQQVQSARKASAKQIEILKNRISGERLTNMLTHYQVEKIEDLTMRQASEAISVILKDGEN